MTTYENDLPILEDVEQLTGIGLYHFAVMDGAMIQLTIDTLHGSKEAWYTVEQDDVIAEPSPIMLDIVRSSESLPFDYAHADEAFYEALDAFSD